MISEKDMKTLGGIVRVVSGMRKGLRDECLRQLVMIDPDPGSARIVVNSREDMVRIDFERPLAWIKISRQDALQLGFLLLEHGGAKLDGTVGGGIKPPPTSGVS